MTLDQDLDIAYQKVPAAYRLDATGPSITDSPSTTIKKFSLAILFQKSRCMLHRKHLMRAEGSPEFALSKHVSLEAAMELLRCQFMVSEAATPGGHLSRDRWLLSALSMHDFLLAAMIVYLSLFHETGNVSNPEKMREAQQERIRALEKSRSTWDRTWSVSAESKKAATVLDIMLKKLQSRTEMGTSSYYVQNSVFGAAEKRRFDGVSRLSLNGMSAWSIQETG
jgi:hypothetical protein